MFSWIFKQKKPIDPPATAQAPAQAAPQQAAKNAANAVAWSERLGRALGDDDALLAFAKEAPSVELKMAAVRAMASEAALRLAEREFRTHDRRVLQLAKQLHAAFKTHRETVERASALIQTCTALLDDPVIPVNRLVELDRSWHALDASQISETQKEQFAALLARLTAIMHQQGEFQAAMQRWSAQARQVLAQLDAACTGAASGQLVGDELAQASATAQHARATRPVDHSLAPLDAALQTALLKASRIEERLALLAELQRPAALAAAPTPDAEPDAAAPSATLASAAPLEATAQETDTAASAATEAATDADSPESDAPAPLQTAATGAAAQPLSASQRWHALPAIADPAITRLLNERFDAWQRAQTPRRPPAADKRPPLKDSPPKAAAAQPNPAFEAVLLQAEAALAAGQLMQAQQHLMTLDTLPPGDAAQRARLNATQAEVARMKGWQQWAGGRARDDLVAQAEALARVTLAITAAPAAASDAPAATSDAPAATSDAPAAASAAHAAASAEPNPAAPASGAPQLQVKAQAEAITELRKRWKELDRAGGATNQALWERFDAALHIAYQPVAAHLAQLEALRQTNLETRLRLLDELDALPMPAASDAAVSDATAGPAAAAATDESSIWKSLSRALDQFQTEWRKLGPVEHTVPRKAQPALLERLSASRSRVESPLQAARRMAQAERQALVTRAQALAAETPNAETVARVRDLQAQWQQHARNVPLARQVEAALWAEFKTATDAVFAQREAAFAAREAVYSDNLAARVALIERLEALSTDTAAADVKRRLAEVETAWRQAGDAPRQQAGALEARYRSARAAAQGLLLDRAQRLWQQACDTLLDKLALCEAQEAGGSPDADSRWAALPALPAQWEQAVARRWATAASPASANDGAARADTTLLQLEAALNLPSPEDYQAARRDLKLRAMKAALESRLSSDEPLASVEPLLADILGARGLNEAQRLRLRSLIAGLRAGAPRASIIG